MKKLTRSVLMLSVAVLPACIFPTAALAHPGHAEGMVAHTLAHSAPYFVAGAAAAYWLLRSVRVPRRAKRKANQ